MGLHTTTSGTNGDVSGMSRRRVVDDYDDGPFKDIAAKVQERVEYILHEKRGIVYSESICRDMLMKELRLLGWHVQKEVSRNVLWRGESVGNVKIDILITTGEGILFPLELKATKRREVSDQLQRYLQVLGGAEYGAWVYFDHQPDRVQLERRRPDIGI